MSDKSKEYDEVVRRYLQGQASREDVWRADPYDPAVQKMAKNIAANQAKQSIHVRKKKDR